MELINCPKCNNVMSPYVQSCSYCGAALDDPHNIDPYQRSYQPQDQQKPFNYAALASLILGVASILLATTFSGYLFPLISLILGIIGLCVNPTGRGVAITGMVISVIAMYIFILWLFLPTFGIY